MAAIYLDAIEGIIMDMVMAAITGTEGRLPAEVTAMSTPVTMDLPRQLLRDLIFLPLRTVHPVNNL